MEARILTMEQIPEALSIARGVFDCCLRAQISDLEMVHIFLQYTEEQNIKKMVEEQKLTLWGMFEQQQMVAMSGMQSEGHITMLYVLPVFQRRGYGKQLLAEMRRYAADVHQLSTVTLSAMPAWTADYFKKRKFQPLAVAQPCPFVPMQADAITNTTYEKKPLSTAAVIGTSVGGLVICAAIAVGFMICWLHGIV